MRVLVVDDEPLIRWTLAETLGEHGYQVVEAATAREARAALCSGDAFDVVVLDFLLPDSNDLTLLADVRRLAPDARAFMMTAFGTPEMVQGALALGAARVISKPFDMTDVVTLIEEILGSRPS